MSFTRNTGWGLAASLVSAPAVLLTSVLLARWLDPAANGQVQATLSLLVVLGYAAQLGLAGAGVFRVRRGGVAPRLVLTHLLWLVSLSGGLCAMALWWGRGWLQERLLLGASSVVVALCLMNLLPSLWMQSLGAVSRATDDFRSWTLAELLVKVGRLLALGLAALLWRPDPAVAMGVVLMVQLAGTLWIGWAVLRAHGLAPWIDPRELGRTVRFGAWSYLHAMTGQAHERADLFMLAALRGDPVEVACYAVAVGVVNRLRVLPLAMASALYPRVAGVSPREGAAFTAEVCRHATLWTLLGGLALGLLGPWALPWLYGPVYGGSVLPFLVLLPGTALFSVALLLGRWFQAVDRQGVNVVAQGSSVLLNVGLNLWLIPRHGAVGAAVASLVSYALQGILVGAWFVHTAGPGLLETFVFRTSDLAWYSTKLRREV